jgi:uncharacterized membrane protein HdeD (DUF308 family)
MSTPTPPPRSSLTRSIALGAAYGVLLRLVFGLGGVTSPAFNWVMTLSFLFLGPFVVGSITISETLSATRPSFAKAIFAPWLAMLLTGIVLFLLRIEGAACLLFALPIAFAGASTGGILAALLVQCRNPMSRRAIASIGILPILLAPLESHIASPAETRIVSSEIRIHATPKTVWQNIGRVPRITPNEVHTTWAQRIGFPRPVEATLSYEGVGGIRHGIFERGLVFVEAVTVWQPNERYAFGIKAVTTPTPPTTLDQHIVIGGRFFDLLDGEYRIEPLADGDILLHLTSRQRLSTDFNGYAGLWSDAVMQNLQTSILQVIQHRCESQ